MSADQGHSAHAQSAEPRHSAEPRRAFGWKVRRAQWALVFEQVWLRLWIVLAVAVAFVAVSYAGLWTRLGETGHLALLGIFAVAAIAAGVHMVRVPWPSREAAIRRIEAVSGIPHRPASTYEDTLSGGADDPATATLWQAHKRRMAALVDKLKAGNPRPRTDRFDPFALRALMLLGAFLATALLGATGLERVRSAFRVSTTTAVSDARLDAWVTPPAYTGKAPVMLADGGTPAAKAATAATGKTPEVPANSVLIVRSSGTQVGRLAVEIDAEGAAGAAPERRESEAKDSSADVQEIKTELKRSATVRVLAGTSELARWRVTVIPDKLPTISLSKPPELTPRGSMKLTYKVADDYGVASARLDLKRVPPKTTDPRQAWAEAEKPRGPRPPLTRMPQLPLRLPPANAKSSDVFTYFEFASHPWAGERVQMTLEAKDVAGQTGRGETLEFILPERKFTKPLARALVEQRRKLLQDPRYRDQVVRALDALTMEPEGFIDDIRIYLGIRTVHHRLANDRTRAALKSSIDQLWNVALRIEDGNLSDAERALREAQDKLAKALEEGASEEEIKRLMAELKQALNDYMKQMAEQSPEGEQPPGQDPNNQTLSQDDLDQMMKNLEDMAKSGSREEAQQLLSEMRDLMERMQQGREDAAQQQRNKETMEMLDQLGDMVGDQQQLMDDTFNEQREGGEEQEGQQGRGQQAPPPGMQGFGSEDSKGGKQAGAPPGKGARPQRGQRGEPGQKGGQGQQGQGDQLGQGQEGQQGPSLRERQRELRERLGKLQEQMRQKRAGTPDKLGEAGKAMRGAEESLDGSDFEGATEQQGQALEEMRQSAQSMAQEMLQNMPQRYGQSGNSPRDPLGRPQRSQGPDLGTSVKVPEQIDAQRAREILEELRRRLGDATRQSKELDYLERLLRRF